MSQENKYDDNDDKTKTVSSNENQVNLTKEQQEIELKVIDNKENVFITGSAGTGKSFIIKQLINKLENKGRTVTVTASTGLAASHLCGVTIHAWLGLGLANRPVEELLQQAINDRRQLPKWRDLDVLFIDEVSMMDGNLLEVMDCVGRYMRRLPLPFGGLQIILAGDFGQLPPVKEEKYLFSHALFDKYFYKNTIQLTQVFRQEDVSFAQMLNRIRLGETNEEDIKILQARSKIPIEEVKKIEPTILYALNRDVDSMNEEKMKLCEPDNKKWRIYKCKEVILDKINGRNRNYPFSSQEKTQIKQFFETMKTHSLARPQITLCIGAVVMLVVNLNFEHKLINGARGCVVGFERSWPIVEFMNGHRETIDLFKWKCTHNHSIIAEYQQIPLKLAWVLTIHKSQGMTLDSVMIDLGQHVRSNGQAYTALSRVKKLENLFLSNFDPRSLRTSLAVIQFYKSLSIRSLLLLQQQQQQKEEENTHVSKKRKKEKKEHQSTSSTTLPLQQYIPELSTNNISLLTDVSNVQLV